MSPEKQLAATLELLALLRECRALVGVGIQFGRLNAGHARRAALDHARARGDRIRTLRAQLYAQPTNTPRHP
jgi:hypothetical protein